MDDFLAAASNTNLNDEFHHVLKTKYNVKRLGIPTSYLNCTIKYTPQGIHVSQLQHIQQVAKYLKLEEATPKSIPYTEGESIDPPTPDEQQDKTITTPFRAALGEIRYIADYTRPDLAFATALARATLKPTQRHWKFMKRLVRYLLATPTHGLLFPYKAPQPLQSYPDADFANDETTRKSFSGTIHQLHGATVNWKSKQQPLVAQSTCEAEYIAAANTAQGTVWLRNMLTELGFRHDQPTTLYIDNAAAIRIAQNTPTKRRKCIDINYHLLQDLVNNNVIT